MKKKQLSQEEIRLVQVYYDERNEGNLTIGKFIN